MISERIPDPKRFPRRIGDSELHARIRRKPDSCVTSHAKFGRIMKSKMIFGLLGIMLPAVAFAQDPAPKPSEQTADADAGIIQIQLSQYMATKKFGNALLPFAWKVEDSGERLTAVEPRSDMPAIIAFDMYKLQQPVDKLHLAEAIANSVAEELHAKASITKHNETVKCGKKKCPEMEYYTSEFEGLENGVPRKCAIEVLPSAGQVVTLSICAEASVKYNMELPEVLHQILLHMK